MKKINIIMSILSLVGVCSLIVIFVINQNIVFKLNGEDSYTVDVNSVYMDEGATAYIFRNNLSKKIKVKNNVNYNKVGTYNINYYLTYVGKIYMLTRTINVVDNIVPEIKLSGNETSTIYVGDTFIDEGATASDNYDGDITDKIEVNSELDNNIEGEYTITYRIKDSSGNENSVARKVIVKKKVTYTPSIDYSHPINKYITENGYNVSVGYYNLATGKSYYYRENKVYYGASLIKTLDALYLYDNNLVNDELKPYINKAISVSDNDSHYYLVKYIGKENLKNYGVNLGAPNTLIGRDDYGNTSVMDQMIYMKKLYELSKDNTELKNYFINTYANYLKFNDIPVMHKYGYWNDYFHESGIILDDEPYIVVILTMHGNGAYYNIIKNISKQIYKFHKGEI